MTAIGAMPSNCSKHEGWKPPRRPRLWLNRSMALPCPNVRRASTELERNEHSKAAFVSAFRTRPQVMKDGAPGENSNPSNRIEMLRNHRTTN